ncbi:MAG TPA: DoxX family protein [Candidatus Dormibacteraeota bacterium]|nr:DoxX family protein [Candidatus Dormibacteraeota bacterium]
MAGLILRLVAAAIFIVQGYRKTFAPADAKGSGAALEKLIASGGLPRAHLLARAVALTELVGGVLLLLGLFARVAALALALTMVVAIVRFKWREGFVGGWDWPFSVLGITLAIAIIGTGALGLDHFIGLG